MYHIVGEDTLKLHKIGSKYLLTEEEAVKVIANKKVIEKLLLQKAYDIMAGFTRADKNGVFQYEGKEQLMNQVSKELVKISKFVKDDLEKQFDKHREKLEREAQEKKNLKKG